MRHTPEVKINFNKKRSFCYYNLDGKRFKIYNWKSPNKKIEPNKETTLNKRITSYRSSDLSIVKTLIWSV